MAIGGRQGIEKDEDTLVFFVSKKVTFIKISFPCILLSFPFLKTKEEPRKNQATTKEARTTKSAFFVYIIWYIQKKVVILHREPAPGMSALKC